MKKKTTVFYTREVKQYHAYIAILDLDVSGDTMEELEEEVRKELSRVEPSMLEDTLQNTKEYFRDFDSVDLDQLIKVDVIEL